MSYLAEKAVIGSILTEPNAIEQVYSKLLPDMFESEIFSKVYYEIYAAYGKGQTMDLPAVMQTLENERVPKEQIFAELQSAIADNIGTVDLNSSASTVLKDYMAREFDRAINTRGDAENIVNQIESLQISLEHIKAASVHGEESATLAEIAGKYKGDYFKERDTKPVGVGIRELDELLGGMEGGDMTVIGARPSVGKSAFATQVTAYLESIGKRIAFFNLEMKDKQVYERFVVAESGIGLMRLRRAIKYLNDEEERFRRANEKLEKKSNIIISTGSKTVSEIVAECRKIKPDVVVIDYLQLLRSESNYRGNRYAEVGAISHAIKGLAMVFNIPVIVLTQLNRVSQGRDNKEPTMAEIRESGDIEQDASQIILLWNMDENDRSIKGCKVEKNRQGNTGKIVLRFNGDLMRFEVDGDPKTEPPKPESKKKPEADVAQHTFVQIGDNELLELPFGG